MKRKNDIFKAAEKLGIEILNAKTKEDGKRTAIHLLNPELNDLEDAVYEAEAKEMVMIVIHNRSTWSHSISVEKVEVDQKLLA